MGKPKKRTTSRRTGNRRSHMMQKLAKVVNGRSPISVHTTSRSSKTEK